MSINNDNVGTTDEEEEDEDEDNEDEDEDNVGDPNCGEDKQEDHMDVEGIGTSSPHHEKKKGHDDDDDDDGDDSKQEDMMRMHDVVEGISPGPGPATTLHMDCLSLFETCGPPRHHWLDDTHHHHRSPPRPRQLLELMGCQHCHSRFVIHRANPWCPSCGMSLV